MVAIVPAWRFALGFLFALGLAFHGYRKKSLSLSGAIAAMLVGLGHTLVGFTPTVSLVLFYFTSSQWTKWKAGAKAKIEGDHKEGSCSLLLFRLTSSSDVAAPTTSSFSRPLGIPRGHREGLWSRRFFVKSHYHLYFLLKPGGQRDWVQVVANGGAGLVATLIHLSVYGFRERTIDFILAPNHSTLIMVIIAYAISNINRCLQIPATVTNALCYLKHLRGGER